MFSEHSQEGIELRLEQTYQRLLTEGKPITIHGLAEEAHTRRELARAYLLERRAEAGQPLLAKPYGLAPQTTRERHQQWLRDAYARLQAEGKAITVMHLRAMVSVSSREAREFLEERGMTWKQQQARAKLGAQVST